MHQPAAVDQQPEDHDHAQPRGTPDSCRRRDTTASVTSAAPGFHQTLTSSRVVSRANANCGVRARNPMAGFLSLAAPG